MKARTQSAIILLVSLLTLFPIVLYGQGSVGLPFLKIGVGARPAGMGGVFTGVADDIYSIYWNPGGLGHMRRWGWSAGYNKWFMDVYQASLTFTQQFRFIGTRKTTVGFMFNYLGMPDWDSTNPIKNSDPVSAGHFLAGISIGHRLDWISPTLALGINVKGVSSHLDTYSAKGIATDAGILYKSKRFRLGGFGIGLFDYGIISLGVSVFNYGKNMVYDTQGTSFPKIIRAGASYRVGRYRGISLLMASDVVGVWNRDLVVGVAGEIWFRNIIGVRAGYKKDYNDLGDLSFGVSLRFDEIMTSIFSLPTRYGDAIEMDIAQAAYGDVLQETYRGSFSHYPVAPEPFKMGDPEVITARIRGESSIVMLEWEEAEDPDPFDQVTYLVLIDQNERKIEEAIRMVEWDMPAFMMSDLKPSLMLCQSTPTTEFATPVTEAGVYHWAVAAYDIKQHARLAKRGRHNIGQFVIRSADLAVNQIEFFHSPWITITPEQGTLIINLANDGIAVNDTFRVKVQDIYQSQYETTKENILLTTFQGMAAHSDTTLFITWSTSNKGPHLIEVIIDADSIIYEVEKRNNRGVERVISIPKGIVVVDDTVDVVGTEYDYIEIPLVPEIYFDLNSSIIKEEYYIDREIIPSVLNSFAERLKANPQITIQIMGSIDALSGETNLKLAKQRANRVRMWLMGLGVPASQVSLVTDHPNVILGEDTFPVSLEDSLWVMEQNRVVRFSVPQIHEETIFGPHHVDVKLRDNVEFGIQIESPALVDGWSIKAEPGDIEVSDMGLVRENFIAGTYSWNGADRIGVPVPRQQSYEYSMSVIDTLGRTFKTRPASVYLRESISIRSRWAFGSALFADPKPVYQFYWDRLMDVARELIENKDMRLRFEGHACVVGPNDVNRKLSNERANVYTQAFKERLRAAYPDQYQEVWSRVDASIGYGEEVPMIVQLDRGRSVLLGDNNLPVGRYRNRRTTVMLYRVR